MNRHFRARVSVGALIAAAGVLLAPGAFAADIGGAESYKDEPVVRRSSDWGGAYVGGHTGSTIDEDNHSKVLSGSNGGPDGNGGTATVGSGNSIGANNVNAGPGRGNVTINGGDGGNGAGGAGGDGGNVSVGNRNEIESRNLNLGPNTGNGTIRAGDGGDGGAGNGGGNGGDGGNINIGDGNRISSRNVNLGPNSGNLNVIGGAGGAGGSLGGGLTAANPFESDDNKLLAGTHFGYNWQDGSTVYGFEADATIKDSIDDYLGSLRGRIGIASQRVLLYATAGVAFAGGGNNADGALVGAAGGNGGDGGDINVGNNNRIGSNNVLNLGNNTGNVTANGAGGGGNGGDGVGGKVTFGEENDNDVGFVGGVGVEVKVSNGVSAGLEGLYYAFGDGQDDRGDFFAIRSRLTFHLQRDQDVYDEPPAVWSGFYVGGHAGVATRTNDEFVDGVSLADGNAGGNGGAGAGGGGGAGGAALLSFEDDSSLIGGGHLGYNWQSNKIVYGLEGDITAGDNSFRDYLATVRVRLGYTMGSHLFYGTAGVAFSGGSRGSASVNTESGADGGPGGDIAVGDGNIIGSGNLNLGDNTGNVSQSAGGGAGGAGGSASLGDGSGGSDDEVGFVLGAGIESKITDRVSFGVEALYYFFDGDDSKLSTAGNGDVSFRGADDGDALVVRGRVSIHTDSVDAPLK
jgi:opacity protein-like surface antigen